MLQLFSSQYRVPFCLTGAQSPVMLSGNSLASLALAFAQFSPYKNSLVETCLVCCSVPSALGKGTAALS